MAASGSFYCFKVATGRIHINLYAQIAQIDQIRAKYNSYEGMARRIEEWTVNRKFKQTHTKNNNVSNFQHTIQSSHTAA